MKTIGTLTYDNLIAGSQMPVVTDTITVAPSQDIKRGEILELDANGQAIAPTGTIDPTKAYCIAVDDIITTTQAAPSVGYLAGEFNQERVIYPTGKGVADYKVHLRKLGIILRPVIKE